MVEISARLAIVDHHSLQDHLVLETILLMHHCRQRGLQQTVSSQSWLCQTCGQCLP